MTPALFDQMVEALTGGRPDVEPTSMFGSTGLKVHGKTFAMLVKGRLVVKLPRHRVEELLAAGAGDRFDPGHGRPMREWASRAPATDPGDRPDADGRSAELRGCGGRDRRAWVRLSAWLLTCCPRL